MEGFLLALKTLSQSRKFWLTVLCIVALTVLCIAGKLPAPELAKWITGLVATLVIGVAHEDNGKTP